MGFKNTTYYQVSGVGSQRELTTIVWGVGSQGELTTIVWSVGSQRELSTIVWGVGFPAGTHYYSVGCEVPRGYSLL